MQVFDGHNDALLRLARFDGDRVVAFRDGPGHVTLANAHMGNMIGGFFAMFALDEQFGLDFAIFDTPPYDTPLPPEMSRDVAWEKIQTQAQIAQSLEADGAIRWARTAHDLTPLSDGALVGILHLEGAECIGADLEGLDALFDMGLRSIGPVWSRPTVFAHGVPFRFPSDGDTGPGLSEAGRRLVQEMKSRSMVVDTSHMTMKGFWDVAELGVPLVATHSNAHSVCPTARNLTDDQLKAIGETGGMAGLNFGTMFLNPQGERNPIGALDHMIPHLAHMIKVAGEDHVGLGSDFDGAPMPYGLKHAGDLPVLVGAMRGAGFGVELIEKLCHGNWQSFLSRTLPAQ
ncbi:MAG: membrane dipeptidase [Aliishimia sp.]